MKNQTTTNKNINRLFGIENMARDAAKTTGIIRALDQAIQHGERSAKDYGGAFDAIADISEALEANLSRLADEVNVEKWGDK